MKTLVKLAIVTILVTSCSSNKQPEDGLPFIDVNNNYPEKEILLTDIADVTYLYLNSDDVDYLYSGSNLYISKNTVVVIDGSSGSILFFHRDGTPKSRFNHSGQGPGEYLPRPNVIYDETADELFVSNSRNVIQVYSSTGEYRRTINLPQEMLINGWISFDDRSLFIIDRRADVEAEDYIGFGHISKTNGEILNYVKLPRTHTFLGLNIDGNRVPPLTRRFAKCPGGVLLSSHGTDTIFLYSGDKSLTPVLYQTPSVTSLIPMEFLDNCLEMGQYQFINVIIVRPGKVYAGIFPTKNYIRDKKTGEIFRQKLIVPDYKEKEFIITPGYGSNGFENGYFFELSLAELKEAYRAGKLSGQLKDLVATLDEDRDNNVFMLVEFK